MKLIIFTSSFPYGKGEQFLEIEINYLSKSFKEVIIIPLSYGGKNYKRKLPHNVRVLKPILPDNKFQRILNSISMPIFRKKYLPIYFKELIKSIKHDQLKLFLSALNIIALSMKNDRLKNVLQNLNERNILYFYWGHGLSFILPFIKEIKARKIMRVHRGDLYEYLYNDYFPFRKNQIESLDYVIPISQNGKDYLEKKYPMFKNKIKLYKLGTKNHPYLSPENVNANIFRIVSCSSLTKVKRVDLIIKILSYITDYKIEWVHFGDGYLKNEIIKKAKSLPPNIRFLYKGFVSNEEILEFYKNNFVDIFINVSSNEGIPVSIMEAISFGIPVIATDVGATNEIIVKETGILLKKDFNPKDVAVLIEKLIKKEIVFNRKKIKEFWEKNYNSDINYTKFSQFLLELG